MSDTQSTPPGGAAAKAQELKEAIRKLDFRDRVIFLGSAALVLLFILPWWRMSITVMGSTDSRSINGLHDAGWLGFLAACAGTVAGLANMGFVPLPPEWKRLSGQTRVQLGVAAAAFLLGPLYFWMSLDDVLDPFGLANAGKTFFFWLAFLAALAAAGAAGWKFADERKKAAPPAA